MEAMTDEKPRRKTGISGSSRNMLKNSIKASPVKRRDESSSETESEPTKNASIKNKLRNKSERAEKRRRRSKSPSDTARSDDSYVWGKKPSAKKKYGRSKNRM